MGSRTDQIFWAGAGMQRQGSPSLPLVPRDPNTSHLNVTSRYYLDYCKHALFKGSTGTLMLKPRQRADMQAFHRV